MVPPSYSRAMTAGRTGRRTPGLSVPRGRVAAWPTPPRSRARLLAQPAVRRRRDRPRAPPSATWRTGPAGRPGGPSSAPRRAAAPSCCRAQAATRRSSGCRPGSTPRTAFHEYGGLCWAPARRRHGGHQLDGRPAAVAAGRRRAAPADRPTPAGAHRYCLPQEVRGGLLCLREVLTPGAAAHGPQRARRWSLRRRRAGGALGRQRLRRRARGSLPTAPRSPSSPGTTRGCRGTGPSCGWRRSTVPGCGRWRCCSAGPRSPFSSRSGRRAGCAR